MDSQPNLTKEQRKIQDEREALRKKITRKKVKRKDTKITEEEAQEKQRIENQARKRCKEYGLKSTKKQSTLNFKILT